MTPEQKTLVIAVLHDLREDLSRNMLQNVANGWDEDAADDARHIDAISAHLAELEDC